MYQDISILVVSAAVSVGGCIGFMCWHMRRSRCTHIKMGCIECTRDVMNTQEMQTDVFQNLRKVENVQQNVQQNVQPDIEQNIEPNIELKERRTCIIN